MQDSGPNTNSSQTADQNQMQKTQNTPPSVTPASGKELELPKTQLPTPENPENVLPEISASPSAEIKIPVELEKFVEKGPDAHEPVLPKIADLKPQADIQSEAIALNTPFGRVKLPMSYVNAMRIFKSTGKSDSMHWLASLVIYQWIKFNPEIVKQSKQAKPQV